MKESTMRQKSYSSGLLALLMLGLAALPVRGAVILLDAEKEGDMAAWSGLERMVGDLASYLPIQGTGSARLEVPVLGDYKAGRRKEVHHSSIPLKDWRPYDRLVLDVLNDGPVATLMRIEVNTEADCAQRHFALPAGRWVRIVFPTAELDPEQADLSRVRDIQIAIYGQSQPLKVYLDNLMLLSPGEIVPAPAATFRSEVVRRLKVELDQAERAHDNRCAAFTTRRAASIAEWSGSSALEVFRDIRRLLNGPDISVEVLAALGERIDRAGLTLARVPSIVAFDQACERDGTRRDEEVLVGLASSMVKLIPRELPLELAPANAIKLSAARNETESVQLAVLPLRRALSRVALQVGDLRSDNGQVLPRAQIDCDVMGYVETKEQPPEKLSYVGWWPDPILNFVGPVSVARGDLQSFWLRVRVPKDQSPGLYRGEAVLTGRGMSKVRIPLTVQVHSFAMPLFSPLPTAITFGPPVRPWSVMLEELVASPKWNGGLKYKWADFLADYYITPDHLYRREGPDFEILDHLHQQRRLGAFNLGSVDVPLAKSGGGVDPEGRRQMLERVSPAYRKAKERGLLGHAYAYGYDEVKQEQYAAVEQTAAAVKAAMPGVLTMTTARDYTYGRDTEMQSIAAWVPTTDEYDVERALTARNRMRQVWWYICIVPRAPYANIFLEYPAIEARLLMGAMTAKYRPDGFLYYQTSLWHAKEPIKTGPFTNWDPRSYRDAHGDGSWLCMREGGLPVPTIRLENYRDGLDDYAYVRILEEAIRRKEFKGAALTEMERRWLTEAKVALQVPGDLVASLTEFSRDPERLYVWRERLAALIETSQERGIDPWAGGFRLDKARNENE
jgi:hypothetical protein